MQRISWPSPYDSMRTSLAIPWFRRDTRIETGRALLASRYRLVREIQPRRLKRCLAICFATFEARFPLVVDLVRCDGLRVELPAFLVSLTMHGLLLVCLAFRGYRVHQESSREFQGGVVDNLMPSSDSTFQDLDQSSNPPPTIAAAGSFAPTLAPTITTAPSSAGVLPVALAREVHRRSGARACEARRPTGDRIDCS